MSPNIKHVTALTSTYMKIMTEEMIPKDKSLDDLTFDDADADDDGAGELADIENFLANLDNH